MSDGAKKPCKEARAIGELAITELKDLCAQIEIAGSVRRGKPFVGDVEIVARPTRKAALLARLDQMVMSGTIRRATYGFKATTKWWDDQRGFVVDGMTVNLFIADEHNWGYMYWLRTGPGEANTAVMSMLKRYQAPYGVHDDYWWAGDKKISVPDEKTLFRLLGAPSITPPAMRDEQDYRRWMSAKKWADLASLTYVDGEPMQVSLF
jgi:DNA polymerase/3'-5' exonuclease PolX